MDQDTNASNAGWSCLNAPIQELCAIRDEMLHAEKHFGALVESVAEAHRAGARNLLHYLALRQREIRPLQEELARFGLSSLGRCESRVLANLDAVINVAGSLTERALDGLARDCHESRQVQSAAKCGGLARAETG